MVRDASTGYVTLWKALEQMITELREKNTHIPASVTGDLKLAKSLLNVSNENLTGETLQQIDIYLQNVESFAVSEGERLFGKEFADEWLRKLEEASRQMEKKGSEERFVRGVPRNKKWMRIMPTENMRLKEIEDLAGRMGLGRKIQHDGNVLVFGEGEALRDFVKQVSDRSKMRK